MRTGAAPISMRRYGDEGNVFLAPLPRRSVDAPQRLRYRGFGQRFLARELQEEIVQDVEIVPLSKQVLSPLEFRAPSLALFRQEALDHIAEALCVQAQLVPDLRDWLLRPALVKLDHAVQLPEKELRQLALVYGDEFGSGRQPARPAPPS